MRKVVALTGMILALALTAGNALAESIQNRIGVTGRIGFIIPSDSDFNDLKLDTDAGFVGGGGLIYGFDNNIALELDVTHAWFDANVPSGADKGEFSTTNISLGVQYRFVIDTPKITPYAGGGIDFLLNEYKRETGEQPDVDTVIGIHVAGGIDYFFTPRIALNAQLKAVIAPDADIKGTPSGDFDPSSVSGSFGIRYFF